MSFYHIVYNLYVLNIFTKLFTIYNNIIKKNGKFTIGEFIMSITTNPIHKGTVNSLNFLYNEILNELGYISTNDWLEKKIQDYTEPYLREHIVLLIL